MMPSLIGRPIRIVNRTGRPKDTEIHDAESDTRLLNVEAVNLHIDRDKVTAVVTTMFTVVDVLAVVTGENPRTVGTPTRYLIPVDKCLALVAFMKEHGIEPQEPPHFVVQTTEGKWIDDGSGAMRFEPWGVIDVPVSGHE
jgi:hypothetical protein